MHFPFSPNPFGKGAFHRPVFSRGAERQGKGQLPQDEKGVWSAWCQAPYLGEGLSIPFGIKYQAGLF